MAFVLCAQMLSSDFSSNSETFSFRSTTFSFSRPSFNFRSSAAIPPPDCTLPIAFLPSIDPVLCRSPLNPFFNPCCSPGTKAFWLCASAVLPYTTPNCTHKLNWSQFSRLSLLLIEVYPFFNPVVLLERRPPGDVRRLPCRLPSRLHRRR